MSLNAQTETVNPETPVVKSGAVSEGDSPAEPEVGSRAEKNRKANWNFTPDVDLPNVLILGDSISIGYTLQVRELLKGKANVFRPVNPTGTRPVNCSEPWWG